MVVVKRNGVLGVVVVVVLQLFPVTVRDIVVVHRLVKLLRLHSGPLPLCIGIGVIGSLMDVVPRLTVL